MGLFGNVFLALTILSALLCYICCVAGKDDTPDAIWEPAECKEDSSHVQRFE